MTSTSPSPRPETSLPAGAAVDELMSRQMDVIVCHPSRASAAGRRDELFDAGAAEAPIVILTESAGGPPGTQSCPPEDGEMSRPAPAASCSGSNEAEPVAAGPGQQIGGRTPWHRLAASLAQELRAPLTLINECCSLVHDGLAGTVNAEQGNYLALACDQVDDLTATIRGICQLGNLEGCAVRAAHKFHESIASLSPAIARKTCPARDYTQDCRTGRSAGGLLRRQATRAFDGHPG